MRMFQRKRWQISQVGKRSKKRRREMGVPGTSRIMNLLPTDLNALLIQVLSTLASLAELVDLPLIPA